MTRWRLALLLSFNGGFADTVSFLGLDGLFTNQVTGNFVTLGATLVLGTQGVIAKLAALPVFAAVIVVAHLAGGALARRGWPAPRLLLGAEVVLLAIFFACAVILGPFPNADAPAALLTAFAGVAGMAVQNAITRTYLSALPATTIMTGNTTQAALDVADLLRPGAHDPAQVATVRARLKRTLATILWFAGGCAVAALLHAWVGFWSLAVPVAVALTGALTRTSD
jgi:uncharacterized membrane protein YoaK (UPF0700 family)